MRRSDREAALRVALISLGCPKNLVDSEVMLGLLRQGGFSPVSDLAAADVILVNTCCFIDAAREECAEALREASAWRRRGTAKALICAGCWPQADFVELRSRFPDVDAFMGPGDVPEVVSVVRRVLGGVGGSDPPSSPPTYLYDHTTPRLRATLPWTAYVKISEGCSHGCTFCVIPRLRGAFRSRSISSIVEEARALAKEGVAEINLVAQDTTAYGSDLGDCDISDLLPALASDTGIPWIRLLYGFPTRVTSRLIGTMARERNVCEYIDLPFQHADRETLRRMGRPGDGDRYLRLTAELRAAMPDIAIRSTFLVGFPGETERQFDHVLEFLEAAELDRVGAFVYSPERGTPAAEMPQQVPIELARERHHRLMSLQQGISLARNRRWQGRRMDVLVERPGDEPGLWVGRSFRDAPDIDGSVLVRSEADLEPGQFASVRVVGAQPYDLVAEAEPDGAPSP